MAQMMKAWMVNTASSSPSPLVLRQIPIPVPSPSQYLVKVLTCGICRTDLHVLDRELPSPKPDVIPGHQIVGRVVTGDRTGQIVGIPWLGYTCGTCRYCKSGRENLCTAALFHGYTLDGGFAEYMTVDARYCFPLNIKEGDGDAYVHAAPLLCGGLIGYRTYRLAGCEDGDVQDIGVYGFGSAAHIISTYDASSCIIIAQIAVYQGKHVYAFTRKGDDEAQAFAKTLGCVWSGSADEVPPVELDAALIFAPVGSLIPAALRHVRPGARVVSGGIHMSDIPSFPYRDLWGERSVSSVANLTRADADALLTEADRAHVSTNTIVYDFNDANKALEDLRNGRFSGSAVLHVSD